MALIRRLAEVGGLIRGPEEMFAPEEHFIDWPGRGDSPACHSFTNMM